jgi:signal transduction histidine kinase
LYRVAEEAVSNAIRHGEPTAVIVRLYPTSRSIVLEIRDDGKGFDVAQVEAVPKAGGIFAMRERMGLVNARLEVESTPGSGSCVRAYIPQVTARPEKSA